MELAGDVAKNLYCTLNYSFSFDIISREKPQVERLHDISGGKSEKAARHFL